MGYTIASARRTAHATFPHSLHNRHLQEGSFNGTERFRQAVDAEQQGLIDGRDAISLSRR